VGQTFESRSDEQVAATLMRHRSSILAWFDSRIAGGLI